MAERVADVVRSLERPSILKVAYFSPAHREREVAEWVGPDFHLLPQPQGDLGRKLTNGFVWAFGQGARRVTAIGTDCVDLTAEIVEEAFEALLDNVDAAVGPALDGGYYLIGMSRFCGAAFRGIPWSTDRALLTTLSRLRSCGLRVRLLPPLSDIDRPEDLEGRHADLVP